MKTFTNTDHIRLILAAQHPKATPEEADFLGYMAGMAAAFEPISNEDYTRASILAAINLHDKDSVFDR